MSAFAKEALAFLLLTLINLELSSPHVIVERSAPQLLDSKVEYALTEALESKNDIFEGENAEAGLLSDKKKEFVENAVALKKESAVVEAVSSTLPELGKDAIDSPITDNIKDYLKKETIEKGLEVKDESKKDVPEHKFTLLPKPDGKDEKPYQGHFTPEEYGIVAEDESEKEADGKLEIGQIPILLPPFLPHSIHMLLRPRTFGGTPLVPLPPAVDISDRLPPIDADVVEESSETAVIEDVESGDKVVRGSSRVSGGHYDNPMSFGIPLPMIPLHAILREISGESKLPGATKSEVLDVKGKKMLLQKKFLSFPTDDKSRFHLRIMSIQPLENVDPKTLKDIEMGKEVKGDKEHEEKDILKEEGIFKTSKEEAGIDRKVIEKNTPSDEKVDLKLHKEIEKREGEDSIKKEAEAEKDISKEVKHTEERKLFPQSDILKVSETKVSEPVFAKPEEKELKKELSMDLDLGKVEAKSSSESSVQSHLLVAKDIKAEEASMKEKNGDVVEEDEAKGLKEFHVVKESEKKAVFGKTEEKEILKELMKKDITSKDMDITSRGDVLYDEKKKISEEKEEKELLKKKARKEKKCKCEEKDSDEDSDEEDED